MSNLSESNLAAYRACLDEAKNQAPVMAKLWYTLLLDLLLEKSTAPVVVSEKQRLHDAWLGLKKHQVDVEQGFPAQLAKVIAREMGTSPASKSAPTSKSLSSLRFQDLQLMGEEQVQDALDEARLQQTLLLVSEAGLAGFSARLSTAMGLKVVRSERNPLRPEVYAQALVAVLQDLPVDMAIRARWLLYGGQIMGDLLQTLYAALHDLLEKQGIKQAGYAVLSSTDEPRRASDIHARGQGPASHQSSASSNASNQGMQLNREQLLTLDHLHRLMSGDYNDSFGDAAGVADAAGLELIPLMPQHDKRKYPSQSLGQSLAMEVVTLMVEQLTADQRLLPPVRRLIADAEPAFLRLGAADPAFFNDKNHPARRLLEAVTAKSMAFTSEADEGFADFMQDLQASADRLTQNKAIGSLDFAALLKGFEDRQTLRNQAVVASQKLAVKALIQAEQRHLLAEKIALEIRQRRDFVAGNAILANFVTGPWSQVMAHERLMMESDTTGKRKAVFSLALGDLLWSADIAQASKHRKRLIKIIPITMDAVREGLLSIDYPLALSKAFFDELMRLHEAALSAPPEKIEAVRKNSKALARTISTTDTPNSQHPWLQSSEALQSGFMDFTDTKEEPQKPVNVPAALPAPAKRVRSVAVAHAPATADPPFVDMLDSQPMLAEKVLALQLGAWVDLIADNQWVRAQLTWISPHGTLFMFTSLGGRSHSMTARMLQQGVAQGRFKLISQPGVLDGALDNVAQAAIRNSVKGRKPS